MKSFFAKSVFLVFISFAIILFSNIQILNIPIFSQEDDKRGFGVQERERAGLHAGNDSRILNNDYTRLILILTVVVIISVSSYVLYKIYLIKRKSINPN
jgi:hypothetical protein